MFRNYFAATGIEGIQVLAGQDLTGDDEYEIKDYGKVGTLSFKALWEQGLLKDKFYGEFSADQGTDWMYDDANSDKLNNLLSEYYTDVNEYSYEQGKANYKPATGTGAGAGAYKNRKVKYPNPRKGGTSNLEIWSDDIINIQNQLSNIMNTAKDADKDPYTTNVDNVVLVGEQNYMYYPGKGWARVYKDDKVSPNWRVDWHYKGTGDERKKDAPSGGWFKSIKDVLGDQNMPTTYLQYNTGPQAATSIKVDASQI
mgnify:CR=1 FL=1